MVQEVNITWLNWLPKEKMRKLNVSVGMEPEAKATLNTIGRNGIDDTEKGDKRGLNSAADLGYKHRLDKRQPQNQKLKAETSSCLVTKSESECQLGHRVGGYIISAQIPPIPSVLSLIYLRWGSRKLKLHLHE
ncbi:Hypothetical predicted protein [Paramuricea clavata]|uniref:Uncharacterized protein n=1 Tax=Paramuricea clavata TaxID=317549 RepID=A0A6S7L8M5_PARCT|nr:Hypothetical predicted protein [Paramuricea clavata]